MKTKFNMVILTSSILIIAGFGLWANANGSLSSSAFQDGGTPTPGSQMCQLQGYVTSREDLINIEGATVSSSVTGTTAKTDRNGYYTLSVPKREQTINASASGYMAEPTKIAAPTANIGRLDIQLTPLVQQVALNITIKWSDNTLLGKDQGWVTYCKSGAITSCKVSDRTDANGKITIYLEHTKYDIMAKSEVNGKTRSYTEGYVVDYTSVTTPQSLPITLQKP